MYQRALAVAVIVGSAGIALAGQDFPPPWVSQGITGQSCHWRWDFDPGTSNPFLPIGSGAGTPFLNGGSLVTTPAGGGLEIGPGGTITIGMPNFPQPNEFKLIWVQFHFYGGSVPEVGANANGFAAQPWGNPVTPSPAPGGIGLVGAQGLMFPFNPDFEFITIHNPNPSGMMILEWLTIDTICAPTPGAGALLTAAGLVAARRRRR